MKRAPLLAALATFAGCSPGPDVDALVRELQADRLQRRAERAEQPNQGDDAGTLQEMLRQLAESQRALSSRQLELATELRQWTQLVAKSAGERQRSEAAALQSRLTDLETKIEAQRTRHAAAEELIRKSLNSTSEQLERFLQRLQPTGPATTPPSPGEERPRGAGREAPPPAAGTSAREGDERQASLWPMWSAAAMSILAGVWLLRQPQRSRPSSQDRIRLGADAVTPDAPTDAPQVHEDAQDLWDTAALLGEAIGQFKAQADDPESQPPPPNPAPAPATRASEPAPGAPRQAPASVERIRCRVPASDHERARSSMLAQLGRDPRVLAVPAPTIDSADGDLEVAFSVLPGMMEGERTAIEQRVYEAAR